MKIERYNQKREFFLTGIVISGKKYKDNDKSILIFSKEIGKTSFVAKGVRKLTSKNRSSTELITCAQFYLHRGKAYNILMQSNILENFLFIRRNFITLSISMAMISFLNSVLPKEQPNNLLYELFLWSLKRLKISKNPIFLLYYFLIKSIDYIGFTPMLKECFSCGNTKGPFIFDFNEGTLFCNECLKNGFSIEKIIIDYYIACKNDDFIKIKKIVLKNNHYQKLNYFLEKWIEYISDRPFNGFIFLKNNF